MLRDFELRVGSEFGQVVGEREAVHGPLLIGFEHRMGQPFEHGSAEVRLLMQDEFEVTRERRLYRCASKFAVTLGRMRIADGKKRAFDGGNCVL